MASDLEKLHGVDPDAITKIKELGITTVEEFYEVAKHPDTRKDLSEKIGVDTFTLEGWSSNAGNFILMTECEW